MPNMADRWVSDCVCHVLCRFDYNEKMVIAGWVVWWITFLWTIGCLKTQMFFHKHMLIEEAEGKPTYLWKSETNAMRVVTYGLLSGVILFYVYPSLPKLLLVFLFPLVYFIGNLYRQKTIRDELNRRKND